MTLPPWAIAVVLAVLAPFAARGIGAAFARRARERSARLLGPAPAPRG